VFFHAVRQFPKAPVFFAEPVLYADEFRFKVFQAERRVVHGTIICAIANYDNRVTQAVDNDIRPIYY
jgi:hypothetical protein